MAGTAPICVVCKRRKVNGNSRRTCRKCAALTAAEGTRGKFGLSKPRRPNANRMFIAAFNKRMLEGKTYAEVAEKFGMHRQTLKNKIGKLRKDGYVLEQSRVAGNARVAAQPPIERKTGPGNVNHGEGKGGVTGCKCELCLTVRRASRLAWNAANKDKVKEYNQNYAQKRREKK